MRNRLLATWLLLALASDLWRVTRPEPPVAPGLRTAELPAVRVHDRVPGTTRLAWEEWPGDGPDAPVVLLVHGSPGDHRAMQGLGDALPSRWRRIAPDMPGFGSSSHDVPDYGIQAYGATLLELMDHLGVRRAHVVGHSLGGGSALELYGLAPDRVASITLIACIGAQEYELLGSYPANHAIHAIQLWGIDGLLWGVPHFGALDDMDLGHAYARNFYDTDQRPLREIMAHYQPPMKIIHGAHDFLVPVEAAREHARLVPQAELDIDETDHFQIFRDPDGMARQVDDFLSRVEDGTAKTRSQADPAREAAAGQPVDPRTFPRAQGPTLLVVGALLALATLVTEDLTCITAGLMVAQGRLGIIAAVIACFVGIFVGDLGLLAAGRLIGRPLLRLPPLRWWVTEAAVDRASAWYRRNGPQVIFTSRFMPGARLPLYVAAGLLKTPALRFAGWFAVAAAVWTPLLVGGAALVGTRVEDLLHDAQRGALYAIGLAVALVLALRTLIPLSTWRGRRLALGWWRRQTRWEFWPMWRVYPPVLVHIARLAIRHGSVAVFTACNPGMPLGGVIGESKRDIGERLGGEANPRLPATLFLPREGSPEARISAIRDWQAARAQPWPLVLKPDQGQRGLDVLVARTDEEVSAYLADHSGDILVQEHVSGVEYGLFYARHPAEPRGTIFSVTEKRPLDVTGDGRSTLEQLILSDERAVCMAPVHLSKHAGRLAEIPAAGERFRLVEIGTHSKGSLFLDGSDVLSEALIDEIDRVSQSFRGGFHFGRYDVRAPSVEDLRAGRFKIIELNGATSEAVHIYDPKNPLSYGRRVLRDQWTRCFEIGAANARMGVPVASAGEIVRAWWAFRRAQGRR